MRVALILPDLNGGGAERVALTLAEDLIQHGHEVDIVLTSSGGDLLPLVPPHATLIQIKAKRFRSALFPLVRYFRTRKPQAVHAFMWPVTVVAIVARRLARSKSRLIVSDHTTLSEHSRGSKARLLAIRVTVALLYSAADGRICVSEGAARDISALSGLPRGKFTVIYNPVVPPESLRRNSDFAEALWPGKGVRILTVGSLKLPKNHAMLLRSFADLPSSSATLVILGDGPLRNELERLSRELGIFDRVRMPGFLIDPWPVYSSADIFVLSSDHEGYPLVLVEAMFAGLTVVSTDCPSGPNEILEGGRFGWLVPVGDSKRLTSAIMAAVKERRPAAVTQERARHLSADSLSAHRKALIGPGVQSGRAQF